MHIAGPNAATGRPRVQVLYAKLPQSVSFESDLSLSGDKQGIVLAVSNIMGERAGQQRHVSRDWLRAGWAGQQRI